MDIDRDALLSTFLAETEDGLSLVEESLISLERRPDDGAALAEVFRVVHTLKGNADTFGFSAVTRIAHQWESVLEHLRELRLAVSANLVSLFLRTIDTLRVLLAAAADGTDALTPEAEDVLTQLSELGSFGDQQAPDPVHPPTEGEDQPRELPGTSNRTIRVDLAKLDRLLTLTGELAVARGRLGALLGDPEAGRSQLADEHLEADNLHLELQELVMKLRMVPVGPVFRHLTRAVRDQSAANGKQARLEIEGEEVEVDTTVIEHLRDPLVQMVRNAVAHGIEPTETRRAAGKDPCGVISVSARHDAGSIVFEVGDDGAGLDREKIRRRALALGMIGDGAEPTEADVDGLIFEAGFTTADHVTGVSGRGVGLDVVSRNIEALHGSIRIRSNAGRGTRITIRLPLTLAILQGFQVSVGGEVYVVPLDAVSETFGYEPDARNADLDQVVVEHRGTTLPVVRLRKLLDCNGKRPSREGVVVVHSEGGSVGLIVDDLQGESQSVIKPLGEMLRGVPGISGSTVLGNGRVAFILDVHELLQERLVGDPARSASSR